MNLADLKPAPYNPRKIDAESMCALRVSLDRFGDISGLVWNQRTGHLIAGHQRLAALKEAHGDRLVFFPPKGGDDGFVVTPSNEQFSVRVVDWPIELEKAANLAANNPLLAGTFIPDLVEPMIAELKTSDLDELIGDLRLDDLCDSLGMNSKSEGSPILTRCRMLLRSRSRVPATCGCSGIIGCCAGTRRRGRMWNG